MIHSVWDLPNVMSRLFSYSNNSVKRRKYGEDLLDLLPPIEKGIERERERLVNLN